MLRSIIEIGTPSAHRRRPLIAVLVATLVYCTGSSAAAARPSLLVEPPATTVQPGDRVEIAAHTADVRSCVLELSDRTGGALRSTAVIRDPSEVTWRWRTRASCG